jgi:hypothetical protein
LAEPLLYNCIVIASKLQAKCLYSRLREAAAGRGRTTLTKPRRLRVIDTVPEDLVAALLTLLPGLDFYEDSMNWAFIDTLAVLQLHSAHSLRHMHVHIDLSFWSSMEALGGIGNLLGLETLVLELNSPQSDEDDAEHDDLLASLSALRPLALQRLTRLSLWFHYDSPRPLLTYIARGEFPALTYFCIDPTDASPASALSVLQPLFSASTQISRMDTAMSAEQLVALLKMRMAISVLCINSETKLTADVRFPASVHTLHIDVNSAHWDTALAALTVLARSPEARGALRHIYMDFAWLQHVRCSADALEPDGTTGEDEVRDATTLGHYVFLSQRFAGLGITLLDRDRTDIESGARSHPPSSESFDSRYATAMNIAKADVRVS